MRRRRAQQLAVKNYTRANGLASDYVLCIYQDRSGFMWFGTDRGVSRYDGQSFATYTTNDGLKSNFINCIFQDAVGAMWFGTYDGGATKFDGERFHTLTTRDGLPDNEVAAIFQDAFGRMYYRTARGIAYIAKDSTITLLSATARAMLGPLADSSFIMVDDSNVRRFIPSIQDKFRFADISLSSDERSMLTAMIFPQTQVIEMNNTIEFATQSGVARLMFTGGSASLTVLEPHVLLNSIVADGKNNIWCTTEGKGIGKREGNAVRWFTERNGLARGRVKCSYRDYEGSLWFGTLGGGVQHLLSEEVVSFRVAEGLPVNDVTTIFQDADERTWIGTSRGVSVIDRDSIRKGFPFRTSVQDVRAFAQIPNGEMLVATFDGMFGPFNSNSSTAFSFLPRRNIPYGTSSIAVQPTTNHDYVLWVGSYGGGTHRIEGADDVVLTTRDGIVSDMTEDIVNVGNSIWLLTRDKGATRIHNNRYQTFSLAQGLPSNTVNAVWEDSSGGTILIGTDKGIVRYRGKERQILNAANGLHGSNVVGIFRASPKDPTIIIVTESALHKLSGDSVQRFGPLVLLPFDDMKISRVTYSINTQTLWFATTGGVVKVDTRNGHRRLPPPKVVLTRLVVDTLQLQYPSSSHLSVLQHDQNTPAFHFATLSFANEAETKFRYRLSSVDKDWSPPTNDPHVQYRNLSEGRYTFSVIAVNPEGTVSSQPAEYSFRILPPFWKTWWFGGSVFMLATAAFAGTVRWISTRELKKQVAELERERAVQQERERISRDLHDHVGAQLVNIMSGLDLVGKYSPPTETRAQRLLKSLQQDARSSMLQLRETIWAIKTQAMTVEKFAAQVENYSRKQIEFYEGAELSFHSEVNGTCELTPIQVLNSFRIVQEALTNCAKHSRAENIWVEVKTNNARSLCITIRDDGVGLRKLSEDRLSGNGVLNMKRRAEEIGARFSLDTVNGKGTEARLEFPLLRKKSSP